MASHNILKILQEREFIDNITSPSLEDVLAKPIKFYYGVDATAQSLHIGNLVGLVAVNWLQRHGHTPIILLGGATSKIGDPSGKSVERPLLDKEELNLNLEKIKTQIARFLDFSNSKNHPKIMNNDDWFSKFTFTDFLRDVGKHFRVGVMLGKESVRSRIDSEEGMSFTEFSYQLLQGYDFYYLYHNHDVVLQIGGSDQWGNITAGIEYTRKVTGASVYGMTWPLLTKSDGKKFGKTEGGSVWLSAELCSPYKFYQYLYRVADSDVIKLLKVLTFVDIQTIHELEKAMNSQTLAPNTAQKLLAEEVTRFVHGQSGLESALRATEATQPGSTATLDADTLRQIKDDIPHIQLPLHEVVDKRFVEIAVLSKLVPSKSEAVRLIKNGGAYLNNCKIMDTDHIVQKADMIDQTFLLLSAGKKNRLLIEVSIKG